MNSIKNNIQTGFTLVEVVIAAALLVLALSFLVVSFVQSWRAAVIADNRLEAIQNARSNMETLVSSAYLSTSLSNGAHYFTGTVSTVPTNISYSVATVTQTPGIVVKNIYLTNRWINPGGGTTSAVSLVGSVSAELHP